MDLKGAITLEYPQNSGFIVIRLIVTPHLNFSSSLELCSLCSQRTPHHNFRKLSNSQFTIDNGQCSVNSEK